MPLETDPPTIPAMDDERRSEPLTPAQKAARTKRDRDGPEGLAAIAEKAYRSRRKRKGQDSLGEVESYAIAAASAAKYRARADGRPCHEDLAGWALATIREQGGRCALSGVPFRLDVLGHGQAPRPFAPSIDRRDATKGYTPDNMRIICWVANCFLGTWGDDPVLEIALGIARSQEGER